MKDQTTGRSETFGEAARHVTNVGAGLAKLGVGAGTVVCVWASNYVEYWLVSWVKPSISSHNLRMMHNFYEGLPGCVGAWGHHPPDKLSDQH